MVECKNSDTGMRNTGATEQCLEGLTIKTAVHIPGFSFANAAAAKDKAIWDAAVADKKIFPLYEVEELTPANTEDTVFEGRRKQYVTASGKKITTYTSMLGHCSHRALKSFNKKEMGLFEFTEDGAILGVTNDDGTIQGQDVVLNIGKRLPATADRPPSTLVTQNYKDFNQFEDKPARLYPTWTADDLFGIFDVTLEQVSASATEIKFKVKEGCSGGGALVTTLIAANVVVKDTDGGVETVTFVSADDEGIYTVTGTGFADGYTVSLDGVVTVTDTSYESPEPLVIAVT